MSQDTLAAIKFAIDHPDMHVDSRQYRVWIGFLLACIKQLTT